MAVYTALRGASTFPDSFAVVDQAIKRAAPARVGRPARKCTLTLAVLSDDEQVPVDVMRGLAPVEREEFNHRWLGVWLYDSKWAQNVLDDKVGGSLLESEWQLRIASLGKPFAEALLSQDDDQLQKCGDLLRVMERLHGPGTRQVTREETAADFRLLVDSWPETRPIDEFWAQGQTRSADYELALRRLYPNYNTGAQGFLSYRPDIVLQTFVPCSILGAVTGNIGHINDAIKRDAHVFECTAMKTLSASGVEAYLRGKLPNYVTILREQ